MGWSTEVLEDAIKNCDQQVSSGNIQDCSTFKTLTESPNSEIRHATIVLLAKRLLTTARARDAYIDDFFSPSAKVRNQASQLDELFWNLNLHGSSPAVLRDFSWLIQLTRRSESAGSRVLGDLRPVATGA